jgi:hypothetical protein
MIEQARVAARHWLLTGREDAVSEFVSSDERFATQAIGDVWPPQAMPGGWLLEAALPEPSPVLYSLLALAVRLHDLDALATVLHSCAELGLSEAPIPRQALGFLLAQQQPDGGFGVYATAEEEERSAVMVRIALTGNCLALLQRISEPDDSRMRKKPASRSPSMAMPCNPPS